MKPYIVSATVDGITYYRIKAPDQPGCCDSQCFLRNMDSLEVRNGKAFLTQDYNLAVKEMETFCQEVFLATHDRNIEKARWEPLPEAESLVNDKKPCSE